MSYCTELTFFVNGRKIVEKFPQPEWTLLWYLRNKLRLTGAKLACGEGGCGACTVMVSKYNRQTDNITHIAVNACLSPVCSMHGLAVTTVEGLGDTRSKLHPVQERIAKAHGTQCGFCTPGMVMSMYTLLRSEKKLNFDALEEAFQANLCRCTGYRPILEAFQTFLKDESLDSVFFENPNKQKVCERKNCCKLGYKYIEENSVSLVDSSKYIPYDPSQEPIFPPELMLNPKYDQDCLMFKGESEIWYRPIDLHSFVKIKQRHPDSIIIVGNTKVGIETNHSKFMVKICPSHVKEMNTIIENSNGLIVGACVTLSQLATYLQHSIKKNVHEKIKIFKSILEILSRFGGKQIRNVASVGGNIVTCSSNSDLNPLLLAAEAYVDILKDNNSISVKMDQSFFTGYKTCIVSPADILLSFKIPYSKKFQYFKTYKQSKRKHSDITIVTAAFNVTFAECSDIIEDITIAFGGVAATSVLAIDTMTKLKGKHWKLDTIELAFSNLINEFNNTYPSGCMSKYKMSLILSLFFKFYLYVANKHSYVDIANLQERHISGLKEFQSLCSRSAQYFEIKANEPKNIGAIGKPLTHASALKHATGEALFCNDFPHINGELYLSLVLSTKAHAKILSIDASEALSLFGVEAFFSAADLTIIENKMGPIVQDEEVFITNVVKSQGLPLGAIVAVDKATSIAASKLVKVKYDELEPIITIENAIAKDSFFPGSPHILRKGNIDKAFKEADCIIEGDCRTGGQEHFYMETQGALAVPKDGDEMDIYCSNQQLNQTALVIAKTLGVPMSKIVTRTKRIGGGFGGKEFRCMMVTLPVAIAAYKLRRPVRCMLDRDEDMMMTGNRHPFLCKYRAACNCDGKITALDITLYNNAGCSLDISAVAMERALLNICNSYHVPNVHLVGYVCKTNLPSNTACRGTGAPQAMLFMETIVRHFAHKLGKPSEEIAEVNLYQEGQLTHSNQLLDNCTIQACWDECLQRSSFHSRKEEIEKFNRENRWKKRGLSIVPTTFGVTFGVNVLMQAGALVHIYTDGSVLLTHGGIEIGQGLHTKMIQVASQVLEIDASMISISETSTDKVPNASQTAGSVNSDLNGMAILNACKVLKERLKPYVNDKTSWIDWVQAAYYDRVSLSATGFYRAPNISYEMDKNCGHLYDYFTQGVACSEVIIDCLTGDHHVLRTDIVMDVGESLNPAIDIGQIEGAFVQGYGLFVMEEILYSPDGTLLTKGPSTYKLPGFSDIPREFNVSLLKGAPNPRAVYSSKAIGEPPLFLSSSVFFAIKEAVLAARRECNKHEYIPFDAPATVDRIRLACEDDIISRIPDEKLEGTMSWSVTL